ncbi:hypothetical protein BKA66DRAFT_554192 [Pyrenochaeta sp. MPI-SDFR-AT-0127]|nr:hypothetical protein BKA66DRAFT_554192 [Pyrenochaeta sp. MPI-SDFR-AT-0127]
MPLQRPTSTYINPAAAAYKTAIPLSVLPAIAVLDSTSVIAHPVVEIWVGYTKDGRNFLGKQVKAPNAEQQVRALRAYYEKEFTPFERSVLRWMYCQVPVIQVGELHGCLQNSHANGNLPREVKFDSLKKNHIMSAGLFRPELLQDRGSVFYDTDAFDTNQPTTASTRSVLCIGHIINKKLLIWPLIFTIFIAIVVAVAVGHLTCSVGYGAEVGSFLGAILGLVWALVLWISG